MGLADQVDLSKLCPVSRGRTTMHAKSQYLPLVPWTGILCDDGKAPEVLAQMLYPNAKSSVIMGQRSGHDPSHGTIAGLFFPSLVDVRRSDSDAAELGFSAKLHTTVRFAGHNDSTVSLASAPLVQS